MSYEEARPIADRLLALGAARDRTIDRAPRIVTLTDDEALILATLALGVMEADEP